MEPHCHRIRHRLTQRLHVPMQEGNSSVLDTAMHQLDEYFLGQRQMFDVPLLLIGTDFQRQVWQQLLRIPYGTTLSYAEQAARIGHPRSVRAVANANGANALSIFVPCHRVVGTNGTLTGYAGGLPAKQFLLQLEQRPLLD